MWACRVRAKSKSPRTPISTSASLKSATSSEARYEFARYSITRRTKLCTGRLSPLGAASVGLHLVHRHLGVVGADAMGLGADPAIALCRGRGLVGSRHHPRHHLEPL